MGYIVLFHSIMITIGADGDYSQPGSRYETHMQSLAMSPLAFDRAPLQSLGSLLPCVERMDAGSQGNEPPKSSSNVCCSRSVHVIELSEATPLALLIGPSTLSNYPRPHRWLCSLVRPRYRTIRGHTAGFAHWSVHVMELSEATPLALLIGPSTLWNYPRPHRWLCSLVRPRYRIIRGHTAGFAHWPGYFCLFFVVATLFAGFFCFV